MEVHSAESKTNPTGGATNKSAPAATAAAAAAKQKDNENGSARVTAAATANSIADDTKVESNNSQASVSLAGHILTLDESTLETLPVYCQLLFTQIDSKQLRQVDLLMVLIYCVALESGFALTDALADIELEQLYWGASFHHRNVLKLATFPSRFLSSGEHYGLKLMFYTLPEATDISLTGIQTGDSLIVTLTPGKDAPGYSVCFSVSRYVLSSVRSQNIAARFRNLRELSFELKDRIYMPAKIYLWESFGCSSYVGLSGVPEEIVYLILKRLKAKDIQNLSKTCRRLRVFCVNYYSVHGASPFASNRTSYISVSSDSFVSMM